MGRLISGISMFCCRCRSPISSSAIFFSTEGALLSPSLKRQNHLKFWCAVGSKGVLSFQARHISKLHVTQQTHSPGFTSFASRFLSTAPFSPRRVPNSKETTLKRTRESWFLPVGLARLPDVGLKERSHCIADERVQGFIGRVFTEREDSELGRHWLVCINHWSSFNERQAKIKEKETLEPTASFLISLQDYRLLCGACKLETHLNVLILKSC